MGIYRLGYYPVVTVYNQAHLPSLSSVWPTWARISPSLLSTFVHAHALTPVWITCADDCVIADEDGPEDGLAFVAACLSKDNKKQIKLFETSGLADWFDLLPETGTPS